MRRMIFAAVAALGLTGSAALAEHHTSDAPSMDIVDIAASDARFTTLVAAVQAADLVGVRKSEGPFTVFAPTNSAFVQLPIGTLGTLLRPENKDALTSILTYHVVPGRVMSADLAGQVLEVETVQGTTVMIDATDGVMVDGAKVIIADIEATNGVIHVIDGVILP